LRRRRRPTPSDLRRSRNAEQPRHRAGPAQRGNHRDTAARGEMIVKQPVESQEHGLVRADAQAGSRWYTWFRVDRRVARRGSPPAAPGSGPGSRRVVRQSGGTGRGRRRRVGRRTREKVPGPGCRTGSHCSLGDGSGADHERTRTAACRSSFILRRRPRLAAPPSGTTSASLASATVPRSGDGHSCRDRRDARCVPGLGCVETPADARAQGARYRISVPRRVRGSSRHCLSAGGCARQTATVVLVVEACGTAGSGVKRAGSAF